MPLDVTYVNGTDLFPGYEVLDKVFKALKVSLVDFSSLGPGPHSIYVQYISTHATQFLCNQEHNIKSISKSHSAVLSSNGLTQAQKTSISRENDPISANQMAKHSSLLR